jgi:hypothetical protein
MTRFEQHIFHLSFLIFDFGGSGSCDFVDPSLSRAHDPRRVTKQRDQSPADGK